MSAPFGDVERDLAQRLVAIGGIHLIGELVALEHAGRADRVAERPVEGRGIFRRIGEQLRAGEAVGLERGPDRADAAVHHVGRREDVAAGLGLNQRLMHQHLERPVVVDLAVDQEPVMAVAGVRVERHVGR